MKTLFVTEKWCDGVPSGGLTNNFHNLFNSYSNSVSKEYDNLFLDECFLNGVHVNVHLINKLSSKNYDNIIFSFLGDSHMNTTVELCNLIGKQIKLIFMWPDTGYSWAQKRILQLRDHKHVSWGGEEVDLNVKNHIFLHAPQDELLYYPDTKSTDISFIGSLNSYTDRFAYLKHAITAGINIFVTGGQREAKLSAEKYAQLIRTSKINLNFCQSPSGKDQFKGRCLEIISSKSLLLEKENQVTKKYLTPNKHYVEFSSPEDLVTKSKYLLSNPDYVDEISNNAYNHYINNYSSKIFWEKVLDNA